MEDFKDLTDSFVYYLRHTAMIRQQAISEATGLARDAFYNTMRLNNKQRRKVIYESLATAFPLHHEAFLQLDGNEDLPIQTSATKSKDVYLDKYLNHLEKENELLRKQVDELMKKFDLVIDKLV